MAYWRKTRADGDINDIDDYDDEYGDAMAEMLDE